MRGGDNWWSSSHVTSFSLMHSELLLFSVCSLHSHEITA